MPGEVPRRGLGAASVVLDGAARVLLVRHTYGQLNWELPGGAAEARESAVDTARREAREEVGVDIVIERLVGVYWGPTVCDVNEISDCGWFPSDHLPRPISDFTVRRIADALADRAAGVWTIPPRTWLR